MLPKLAIVTTHPIQYNAPLFRMLSERNKVQVKVFYTWEQSQEKIYDPYFKREIKWDIPLLEGYDFVFLKNTAKDPGAHHFNGINNPSIIKEINDFCPDAIFVYGWNFRSNIRVLRFFKGKVPLLFKGDSTLLDDAPGAKSILRRLFLTWVYRHIDVALYVGQNNKNYFLKNGLKSEQLVFAPHAIDNERFSRLASYTGENKGIKRSDLGLEESDTVFLFAGKFEEKKNPLLLINSFKRLPYKNAKLVMVGNGKLEKKLKEISASDSRIKFLDFQNQMTMPSVYKMADVFVLPSSGPGETWGLAVNEAMICSKAVLVSDKCGCAVDLIEVGVNGYTFNSLDGEDLETKLHLLVKKSKAELVKMGLQSYKKIQDWSIENISISVESVVKKNA